MRTYIYIYIHMGKTLFG